MRTSILTALAALLLVTACSPLTLINGASPSRYYERTAGIAYGSEERQALDLYRPAGAGSAAPVVVFFYGGAWDSGAKEKYEFVASALTEAGYGVIIPDYRLYPAVTFPDFVDDGALAIAWLTEHGGDYGLDSGTMFLMGHSAGAHIAALLALDSRYLERQDVDRNALAGLIGLSGPYDFLPLQSKRLESIFPSASRDDSQPIHFAGKHAPPSLLIHGADDRTVLPENSRRLASTLREAGVDAVLRLYDGVGHARVVAALAPPLDFAAATAEDSIAFLDAVTERRQQSAMR